MSQWKWRRLWAACAVTVGLGGVVPHAAAQQSPILIGQTVGITGSAAATVKESMLGASLYFKQVNAQGGVGGRQIELVEMDDKFDPALTLDNARVLIEDKKSSPCSCRAARPTRRA